MTGKKVAPWIKVDEQVKKVGYRTIAIRTFILPDGRSVEFTVNLANDPVCVLALTPDHNVILARQYRPGPQHILLELPGGAMEDNEPPTRAAERELREETGYTGKLHYLTCGPTSAYSTAIRYHFVATDCTRTHEQQLDPNEFIDVVLMPLDEFRKHIRNAQLTDVTTAYLGLDHLGLL